MASHLLLVSLLCLVAASTAYHAELEHRLAGSDDAGFRAELQHPYAGSSLTLHDMWRRSARASKARVARLDARARLARSNMSSVPLAHISDEGYTVTVGIGTPPQPHTLVVDTGSDLTWTQCSLFNGTRTKQREPLFDPAKSSTFAYVPCSSKLCTEDNAASKSCAANNKTCRYDYAYGSVAAAGVLAYEAFKFQQQQHSISLGFGCGALTDGSLLGASGILGLSPAVLSVVSQLEIPKFSYCLTPYADRKSSPLFFGAWADLRRYKTTGPIQSVPILKNPARSTFFYYVPLVGLSLGTRRLDVPASAFAMDRHGAGGTVVDCGSTIAYFAEPGFKAVKEAVLQILHDFPQANRTVEDYELCFTLPSGVSMGAVHAPPLVLHFDGGVDMVLPKSNYFQEPRPGLMCLAVGAGFAGVSIIGNVQQQNFHVLYDVRDSRFLFAPASCDEI